MLLAPDGSQRVLTSRFEAACDPDVSLDGKRLLFAGKPTSSNDWNIFEMNLENLETRQITRSAGNCRSPIYTSSFYTITEKEPWEQIVFVSTRAGQANEFDGSPATSLCTSKLDGSLLQRITHNLSSDLDPAIMADGRVLYAAWRSRHLRRRRARAAFPRVDQHGRLGPGRGRFSVFRRGPVPRTPCVTTTGLVVFVEADSIPWDGAGRLSAVSLRRPLHTYRPITKPGDGLYHSPSPLPDGRILVAWRPGDGSGSFGIYRLDPATGRASWWSTIRSFTRSRLEPSLPGPGLMAVPAWSWPTTRWPSSIA